MLPTALAVRVEIPRTPVKFILSVPVPALVNPPVPAKAVVTVSVPLLVRVTPVTVTDGIEKVPLSACELVSKVCTPVPALKLLLLIIPPLKVIAELPKFRKVDMPLCSQCELANMYHTMQAGPWGSFEEFFAWRNNAKAMV